MSRELLEITCGTRLQIPVLLKLTGIQSGLVDVAAADKIPKKKPHGSSIHSYMVLEVVTMSCESASPIEGL